MKHRFIPITISIILFLQYLSCSTRHVETDQAAELTTIHIDPTRTNSLSDLSALVADIEFIPLETRYDNLMDWCRKIWYTNNKFLMLTGDFEVHCYTKDGEFAFKVTKEGKGRNELLWIFDISPGSGQSFYISGYLEFYEFDFKGNYINTHPINLPYEGYNPTGFHIVGNTFQLFSTATSRHREGIERFSFVIYDVLNKKHDFALYMPTANVRDNVFFQCDTLVIIAPVIGVDTIYFWNYNRIEPKFYIDFGKYKVDRDMLPQDYLLPQTAFSYASINRKCLHIHNPLMNDEWLMFNFYFYKYYYRVYYNKTTKNSTIVKLTRENECLLVMTQLLAVVDNKFVTCIPAHILHELLTTNRIDLSFLNKERQQEILNQIANVKETDNPVLMFITMKCSSMQEFFLQ